MKDPGIGDVLQSASRRCQVHVLKESDGSWCYTWVFCHHDDNWE